MMKIANKTNRANYRGCLVGGAVGDAKGYNVRENGKDLISDNTQMTSFTTDGLIWADNRAANKGVYAYIPCLFYSYQKWYYTQTGSLADKNYSFILKGEILDWEELFARRGHGMTSMKALGGSIHNKFGTIKNRVNNNKGCGSVMRVAPIGLYFHHNEKSAFRIGCESAALTHGHIDAILASGFFSYLISGIVQGGEVKDVAMEGLAYLKDKEGYENCYAKIKQAILLSSDSIKTTDAMREIGEGLAAEEAIAIALYLAIKFKNDFEGAIVTSSKFDGSKDNIGSICGNIMGTYLGDYEIPYKWIQKLELADLIFYGADRILDTVEHGIQSVNEVVMHEIDLG